MKKTIMFFVALFTCTSLVGCSLVDKVIGERANGVVLYGEKQEVKKAATSLKDELESTEYYDVKTSETNGQKFLMMEKTTAEKLVKKGLFRKVTDERTNPITTLPSVTKDEGIIFAKEDMKDPVIEGQTLNARYEGNTVIGSARRFFDSFIIVGNDVYKKLKGTDHTIGILLFSKASDSEKAPSKLKEIDSQLVTIKTK